MRSRIRTLTIGIALTCAAAHAEERVPVLVDHVKVEIVPAHTFKPGQSLKVIADVQIPPQLTALEAMNIAFRVLMSEAQCMVAGKLVTASDMLLDPVTKDGALGHLKAGPPKPFEGRHFSAVPLEAAPTRCELTLIYAEALGSDRKPLAHYCYTPEAGVRSGSCVTPPPVRTVVPPPPVRTVVPSPPARTGVPPRVTRPVLAK